LIVDDNPFSIHILITFIEQMLGVYCSIANSEQTAITLFEKSIVKKCCKVRFKIIIIDVGMKFSDSCKFVNDIRSV